MNDLKRLSAAAKDLKRLSRGELRDYDDELANSCDLAAEFICEQIRLLTKGYKGVALEPVKFLQVPVDIFD